MKNKLSDLNNHLFEQLERLNDEDLKGDALNEEIGRANAVTNVASQIIQNGALVLKAAQFADNSMNADYKIPKMLKGDE